MNRWLAAFDKPFACDWLETHEGLPEPHGDLMKTKKILLWSVVSVLVIAIVAATVWWLRRPQVITFNDDSKVTLLSVEYGKRHAPPTVKASTTPTTGAPARRGGGSSFTTTTDTLVLWVGQEYDSKQYHNFQYYAYDKADTACVQTYGRNYGNGRQGSEIVAVQLDAFPRRQGKFVVRVQQNSNGDNEVAEKKFVISNPARKSFPTWTPESLPATKEDEDLSVTLTKLVAGANMPYTRNNDDQDDAMNKGVQATFQVARNGVTATNWQPVSIETSDATGNHINGSANNQWNGNDDVVTYQWGLWPDEPTWKIRLEFSQQSNFSDGELWTVQNIPLQPGQQRDFWNYARNSRTNSVVAETDLNGFHLKVFPAKQFTDMSPNSQPQGGLVIQTDPTLPDGMRMTIAKLTDDQGNNIGYWGGGWSRNGNMTFYQYSLREVSGATNLNLTIALHKSRYVEFTAKPTKETAAAAQ